MKMHCILFGLFILCFCLPCALLNEPEKITGLQVNGQEANETYTIDKNIKVNVSCTFANDTSPGPVRMFDNKGHEDNSTMNPDGLLTMSLGPYNCQDEWPTIRCEAPGSNLSRSVIILIKCPAQFSDMQGEDFIRDKGVMSIKIKSHTNSVHCLTRDLQQTFPLKPVDCKVSGQPPYLDLTLNITTDWREADSWTLFIKNGNGTSNKTFSFRNKTILYLDFWKAILFLGSSCVLVATIFTAVVILCVCNRRPLYESTDCITLTSDATTEPNTPGQENSEGLVYGELDFSDKITSDVIIGSLPETQYANILFAANENTCK